MTLYLMIYMESDLNSIFSLDTKIIRLSWNPITPSKRQKKATQKKTEIRLRKAIFNWKLWLWHALKNEHT